MIPGITGGAGPQSLQGGAGGAATNTTNNSSGFSIGGFTFASGKGQATANAGMNPWLIGGLAVAGLLAVWMIARK